MMMQGGDSVLADSRHNISRSLLMDQHISNPIARHAQNYIDTWNEADTTQRQILMEAAWTPSARYADPLMQGEGRKQIDGLIAAVHERFPNWRFALIGNPEQHGDYLRFSWMLGPAGADGPIKGTDFAILEDGRFSHVVGFLDQVPEAALNT